MSMLILCVLRKTTTRFPVTTEAITGEKQTGTPIYAVRVMATSYYQSKTWHRPMRKVAPG